ncbi:uncharacterized protein LOC108683394 [Hyalella azteca]|uniref:Uncharacterized protein LOC108683394 n=1 Tax=Hyalella azteca TaxID=294128 RepID=A0A8B7PQB9_HYAAZ|nr:uncharacterized protein LOC108683394 [Hyalella azteca]XP_047737974.1 uncharacterized protein LOC108683394 [Hyalella azteca]
MAERYLYYVSGEVLEIAGLSKAVLKFELGGNIWRTILWCKNFFHENEFLDSYASFNGILNVGDRVTFHCHPYDKDPNPDACEYFAARAWRSLDTDEPLTIANQQGRVELLEPGKGVLEFMFFDKVESVLFLRSKYYNFGRKITTKALTEFLNLDDMVQFDAVRCKPTQDNKHCSWMAKLVWKGKKPTSTLPGLLPSMHNAALHDDADAIDDDGVPVSESAVNAEHRRLYQDFESHASERSGSGAVMTLLSEEAGVALWLLAPNRWETVFFHRSVAFLDDIPLAKYNLQESCPQSTKVELTAVPSVEGFPCKWVARRVLIPG